MTTTKELKELIDAIEKIVEDCGERRIELRKNLKISNVLWELDNPNDLMTFVKDLAGQAGADKDAIAREVKALLATSPSSPTVSWLEIKLNDYRAQLNLKLLKDITANISQYQQKIDDSSAKLDGAVKKLSNMNEAFGAIVLFVNLIEAMINVSSGNFNTLAKVLANLP
jgi:hypothetical protein